MSGRSPAYVPTTSSRVRSTSIVALTVSRSSSTSQPAAAGSRRRALERGVGRADEPVVGPRDEEDDLARAPGSSARSGSGSARAARRGGRRGWAGSASSRPRTGDRARPPRRRSHRRRRAVADLEVGAGHQVRRREAPRSRRDRVGPQAGRADPGDGHARRRRSRSEPRPACTERRPRRRRGRARPPRRPSCRRVGASSSVVGLRQPAMPAAVVARAEDVVQRQAGVVERLRERTGCP